MRFGFIVFMSFMLIGCAGTKKAEKNPFDALTLEKLLVVGETAQSDIVKELGSPNVVAKSSREGEVWTYTRMSQNSDSSYGDVGLSALTALAGVWFLPSASVGGSSSSQSSESMDLVLTFDEGHVLADYSVVQTKY